MLVIPSTARAFYETYSHLLYEDENRSQLILRNLMPNLDKPYSETLVFGAWEEAGKTTLLFGYCAPYNVILFAPEKEASAQAVETIAEEVTKRAPAHRGVNASASLYEVWNAYTTKRYAKPLHTHTAMDIMELTGVNVIDAEGGCLRYAREEDESLIAAWYQRFVQDVGETPRPAEEVAALVSARRQEGNLALWVNAEGEPCCMAMSRNLGLTQSESIGWVYTPPEKRCRGYCKRLIAALCRDRLAAGVKVLSLFVDKANPFSNAVYTRVGFRYIEDNIDGRYER